MIKHQWTLESRLVLVCMTMLFIGLQTAGPAHSATAVYDVKKYGAVGNGSQDDTAAINRTIAAASAHPGSAVYFPQGQYVIGDNLSPANSIILKGDPNDSSQLMFGGSSRIEITGNSPAVENLFINGDNSKANEAILVSAATNYIILGCNIGGWKYGVHTTGSAQGEITSNRMYPPSILSLAASVYLESAGNTKIHGNKFDSVQSSTAYGIYDGNVQNTLEVSANTFISLIEGCYANSSSIQNTAIKGTDNTFTDCTTAFDCRTLGSADISTNKVTTSSYGVYIDSVINLKCSNNAINAPANTGIYVHDYIDNPPQNTISGNLITNLPSGTYGIYATEQFISANPTSHITGNTISGSGYAGIYIVGQENSSVTSNTISGCQYGVYSFQNAPLSIKSNSISEIQYSGIYSDRDDQVSISSNNLRNCGLSSGAYAVIYAYSLLGGNFVFQDNIYTAKSTPNLTYFIYAYVGQPITFNGNKTNTTLPNYP